MEERRKGGKQKLTAGKGKEDAIGERQSERRQGPAFVFH
jgi:hypothetical protein